MKTLVIGNPEDRRVAFFQRALQAAKQPPAEVISYLDLLTNHARLEQLATPGTLLRIESPGESFAVERALLQRGADLEDAPGPTRISSQAAAQLTPDLGRILYPRQWYLGFRALLRELSAVCEAQALRLMNHPAEIAVMFDKSACHQRFVAANIPTPKSLGIIKSYEELRQKLRAKKLSRVFVKLSHGSSASGVVAYQDNGTHAIAITSAELVRQDGELRLYNSLQIRRYTQAGDLEDLLDFILREGAIVEEWLPKAVIQDKPFDLRVVVIKGQAKHLVVRLGDSPMTNLHLGNARGDTERFRESLSTKQWNDLQDVCQQAAAVFPKSLYAGVDLLLTPGLERLAVLEINAFGDLLPNVFYQGQDTYAAELQAVLDA